MNVVAFFLCHPNRAREMKQEKELNIEGISIFLGQHLEKAILLETPRGIFASVPALRQGRKNSSGKGCPRRQSLFKKEILLEVLFSHNSALEAFDTSVIGKL